MDASKNILIAIDNSEASSRAVAYVARMIAGKRGFRVRLFHALAPFPPGLREFEWAEDPKLREETPDKKVKEAEDQWVAQSEKAAQPVFARAKSVLRKARMPARAVETQISPWSLDQDLATKILEAARANQCGTIVVGRGSFSGLRELLHKHVHVADELIRKAQGFTLWVVE